MKHLCTSFFICALLAACGNHNPSGDSSKTDPKQKAFSADTSGTAATTNAGAATSAASGSDMTAAGDSGKGQGPSTASFYKTAIESNLSEIKMAKLALNKSSNEAIKKAAAVLVKDHSGFLAELKSNADSTAKADTSISGDAALMLQNLSADKGKVFDNKWLNEMINGHDKTINNLQAALSATTDDKVKSFAARALPIVSGHKKMLESIKQKSL